MQHIEEWPLALRVAAYTSLQYYEDNGDGNFHLGTTRMVFPRNYAIPFYDIFEDDEFTKEKEPATLLDKADKCISAYHRQFWGVDHNPDKYPSFPEPLTVWCVRRAEHQWRWSETRQRPYISEYLNPLRSTFEGDGCSVDRIMPNWQIDMKNICSFCMCHAYNEVCYKFWSPHDRHIRIREINFTLWVTKGYQLCLSCLQREEEHRGYEECKAQQNCCYCSIAGHHKSLCTSAVHHRSLAAKRAKKEFIALVKKRDGIEQDKDVQLDYEWLDSRTLVLLDQMHQADLDGVERYNQERTRRQYNIANLVKNDYDSALAEQLRQQEKERQREPKPNVVLPVARISCVDQPMLDLHHQFVTNEIEKAMSLIRMFEFTKELDRHALSSAMKKVVDQIVELFKCSKCNGTTGKHAMYFCGCGAFRLCTPCLNKRERDGKLSHWKTRRCNKCNVTIEVAKSIDSQRQVQYTNVLSTILTQLNFVISGFGAWSRTRKESPDLVGFTREVKRAFANIAAAIECPLCYDKMAHESHHVVKLSCQCGHLQCWSCLVRQQMDILVEREPRIAPTCSKRMEMLAVKCPGCRGDNFANYGAVAGLTVLSAVTAHFLEEDVAIDETRIVDLWKDKVESFDKAAADLIVSNLAVVAAIQAEEDEERRIEEAIPLAQRLERDAMLARAYLNADVERYMLTLQHEGNADQEFEQGLMDLMQEDIRLRAERQEAETNAQIENTARFDAAQAAQIAEAANNLNQEVVSQAARAAHAAQEAARMVGGRIVDQRFSRLLAMYNEPEEPIQVLRAMEELLDEPPFQVVDHLALARQVILENPVGSGSSEEDEDQDADEEGEND